MPEDIDDQVIVDFPRVTLTAYSGLPTISVCLKPRLPSRILNNSFSQYAYIGNLSVMDNVVDIAERAFSMQTQLSSVTFCSDSNVLSIGKNSFNGRKLSSFRFPSSVKSIQCPVFYSSYENNLTSIVVDPENEFFDSRGDCNAVIRKEDNVLIQGCNTTVIPSDVCGIGDFAFENCYNLVSATVPDTATFIGEGAFYYCSDLTSVTIGNSVSSIGEGAFERCSGLTSITIPDSVGSIGNRAFRYCRSLDSFSLPDSVTFIGWQAFYDCNLSRLSVGSGISSLDNTYLLAMPIRDFHVSENSPYFSAQDGSLFSKDGKQLVRQKYTEGEQVCTIRDGTVSVLNGSIPEIYEITSYVFPDSVRYFGYHAIYRSEASTSQLEVRLGDHVENMTSSSFPSCVYENQSFPGLYVVDGKYAVYEDTEHPLTVENLDLTRFKNIFCRITDPNVRRLSAVFNNRRIDEYVSNYSSLEDVFFVDGITEDMDTFMFYYCNNLTAVSLPPSIKSMKGSLFSIPSACVDKTTIEDVALLDGWALSCENNSLDNAKLAYIIENCAGIHDDFPAWNCTTVDSVAIPSSYVKSIQFLKQLEGAGVSVGDGNPRYHNEWNSIVETSSKTLVAGSGEEGVPFPSDISAINSLAFSGKGSGHLEIPDTVRNFHSSALCKSGFSSIDLKTEISSIPYHFFRGCYNLTSVTLPDTVSSIMDYAFTDCSSLTSISIPDSVPSIGVYTFYNCMSLTSITIPDSVTSIGFFAFYNCNSLTSITIPDSVSSIADWAFSYCSSLASITIPDSVSIIKNNTFYDCRSLASITIPDSVSSIGGYTFYNCSSLISITIPDSVPSIGNYTFYNCRSLTSITIPNSVSSIGDNAFSRCNSISSITIPNSVSSIERNVFSYCNSLTSISIPDSVSSIGDNAFSYCSNLTSIIIPDSVSSIGNYAFNCCSSLTSITIPDSVPSIGNYTFYHCDSISSIIIPDSVSSIGNYAFSHCDSISSITIPDSVTSIEDNAFSYCSSLTSITIPDSVSSIGNYAFANCSSLTSISFPDSVSSIGEWTLAWCSSLTSITIPDSVSSIGSNAFYHCDSLTSITIPDSVTSMGDSALGWCKNLVSITFQGATSIGKRMFNYCYKLESVDFGNSVTSIGDSAFGSCNQLVSITIPNSMETIGQNVFNLCSNLATVTLPERFRDQVSTFGAPSTCEFVFY